MHLRKLLAVQLAVCVVCSNVSYVFGDLSLFLPVAQAILLCAITLAIVRHIGKNSSIAVGAAVWVGMLSAASYLLALAMRPTSTSFDAGIYDRVPLFLGLTCAALCVLFWILLPWEPLEEGSVD